MRRSLVLSSSIYTIHGPLATLRKGGAQIPHSQPISAERLSLDARHAELHDQVLTVVCRRSLTSEPACFIQGRECDRCFVDVNESAHSMRVLYKQNKSSLQQTRFPEKSRRKTAASQLYLICVVNTRLAPHLNSQRTASSDTGPIPSFRCQKIGFAMPQRGIVMLELGDPCDEVSVGRVVCII